MTKFADKLRELRERATHGEWVSVEAGTRLVKAGTSYVIRARSDGVPFTLDDHHLIAFLANHAAEIEDLVRAAEMAKVALKVWVNTYASDMCDEETVKECRKIVDDHGGTLAYIADVNTDLSEALAALNADKLLCKPPCKPLCADGEAG